MLLSDELMWKLLSGVVGTLFMIGLTAINQLIWRSLIAEGGKTTARSVAVFLITKNLIVIGILLLSLMVFEFEVFSFSSGCVVGLASGLVWAGRGRTSQIR